MLNIASKTAEVFKDNFSLEMWGGATFDVGYMLHQTLHRPTFQVKNYL
jgi:pyruvate carboxylase